MEISGEGPAASGFGKLQACLVEGDSVQRGVEIKLRRKAVAISIVVQSAAIAALVIVPLLMKTETIAYANITPVPPYYPHAAAHAQESRPSRPPRGRVTAHCAFCAPTRIPDGVVILDSGATPTGEGGGDPNLIGGAELPACVSGCINLASDAHGPVPPRPEPPPVTKRIHVGTIQPAMLTNRVEPRYPTLMMQIHREGRVELRAVISVDGSVQSLQAVAGDPMFFASALEAVRQWHYRPTVLNGQAVEVDTVITVTYSMQQH